MKYLAQKDKKKRLLFEKFELYRKCLRVLSKDCRLAYSLRLFYKMKLNNLSRNMSKTRIKNRCLFSGRGRGVFRFFRMSRLNLHEMHMKGILYGIRKSSW